MDFRNWTHILSIFSVFLKWMNIFYNFKRGACWEPWVMSQLHQLWGKESSLPLLPPQLYFKAPWRVRPVLTWVGTHSPSSELQLWRWGPMTCWACGQHPQHLAGHTHSDHTVWVGDKRLSLKEVMLPEGGWGGVLSREMHAIFTGHICSTQHVNTASFPSACHNYSAKILRTIYRTKVSTWFLLRCWWSGGGSCQMRELWIGHLGSI